MITEREALELALEALENSIDTVRHEYETDWRHGMPTRLVQLERMKIGVEDHERAITAIKEALAQLEQEPVCDKCHGLGYYDEGHECDDGTMAGGDYVDCDKCKQPEFIKHEVESAEDWSEWVCPNPQSYLMKCCDCGLVHEAQFNVVRYKSEDEREECDMVDDPNVQVVFRMRRSEEWTPKDTAYRPSGLAQPEQEPVALDVELNEAACELLNVFTAKQPPDFDEYTQIRLQLGNGHSGHGLYVSLAEYPEEGSTLLVNTTPPQRTWVGLDNDDLVWIYSNSDKVGQAISNTEAKLKEKNT